MTEKRFTIDEDKIKDNQSPYCYIEYYKGLVPIVDLLNGLAEENQQCKEYNAKLYSNSMKSEKQLLKQIKELKEENKKIKHLIKRTLEITPIEHNLAVELKNSVREFYD